MKNAMGVSYGPGGERAASLASAFWQQLMPVADCRRPKALRDDAAQVWDDLLFGELTAALERFRREPKPVMARSRTVIRGRLEDNPYLSRTNYAATLAALPKNCALLTGMAASTRAFATILGR